MVENINHTTSAIIGAAGAAIVSIIYSVQKNGFWTPVIYYVVVFFACLCIRMAIYDPMLNIFRIFTKTNPTGRVDYSSDTTTAKTEKYLTFWQKRMLAVLGYAAILFLHL